MIYLSDNDIIEKLAICDLLDDALRAYDANRSDVWVIPTLKYRIGVRSPRPKVVKRLGAEVAARLVEFLNDVREIQDYSVTEHEFLESLDESVEIDPGEILICHCTDCQRHSGSAFAMSMPGTTTAFHIAKGAPKPWRHESRGAEGTSWFCDDCGGRIYGERNTRPNSVNVRAGTLDDTTWLRPAAHLFMRSA